MDIDELPVPPPVPEPVSVPTGRFPRLRRLPKRFRDILPATPTPINISTPEIEDPLVENPPAETRPNVPSFRTDPNALGVYKIYPHRPSRDPEGELSINDLCDSPGLSVPEPPSDSGHSGFLPSFAPFLNKSIARIMCWVGSGSNQKSIAEVNLLVHDVLLAEDFKLSDLKGFSAIRENNRLDEGFEQNENPAAQFDDDGPSPLADGWCPATVKLPLPAPKVSCPESEAPVFEVPGLLYRPLLDVMTEAFEGEEFLQLHLTPFKLVWDPNHNDDESSPEIPLSDSSTDIPAGHELLYGEIYNSKAMLDAHSNLPPHPHLETVIAAFMFWSDSTHLANFGNAALWPLYSFFGNMSKYTRAKPTSKACHHQAYIPSVVPHVRLS